MFGFIRYILHHIKESNSALGRHMFLKIMGYSNQGMPMSKTLHGCHMEPVEHPKERS